MKSNKLDPQRQKIIEGLELAYEKMIQFKISKNSPVVISKNGKVVLLDPKMAKPTTKYKWN